MAKRYETPQLPFEEPGSPEAMLRTVISVLGEGATSTKAAGTKSAFEKAVASKSIPALYQDLVAVYGEEAADAIVDLCNGDVVEEPEGKHLFADVFSGAQI